MALMLYGPVRFVVPGWETMYQLPDAQEEALRRGVLELAFHSSENLNTLARLDIAGS